MARVEPEKSKEQEIIKNKNSHNQLYKNMIEVNPKLERYGNRKIEIIDFCLFNSENKISTMIDNDEIATVYVKLKSNVEIKNVMVTFSIKDFNGIEYCGITEYVDLKKNQDLEINYQQKLPLKPERYTLSLGCGKIGADGNIEIFDRMYDCILFQIISDKSMLGICKLDSKVTKIIK